MALPSALSRLFDAEGLLGIEAGGSGGGHPDREERDQG
jgi:hypothetical protein